MDKILISWSSGKDSAWALHELRKADDYEVVGLLTVFNEPAGRVSMHAVRQEIVAEQARQLGLPLYPVWLPHPCPNSVYETKLQATLKAVRNATDIVGVAFGDLLLEEIRTYREEQFRAIGLETIFPIWQQPTETLASKMINSGMHAIITCVDPKHLDASFAGREFSQNLLDDLPSAVDPCGENGEFHTCIFAGPMFKNDIEIETGKIVNRDGFFFADLTLKKS